MDFLGFIHSTREEKPTENQCQDQKNDRCNKPHFVISASLIDNE